MNIDFLEQLCGAWPGVTTDIKWENDFVFSVGEKMFCVCSLEPPSKIAFKVKDEEFEELSMRDGFQPAPYMAKNKWVLITNPGKLNREEWSNYVKQSYELVKSKLSKKLQENLGKVQGTRHKAQERPRGEVVRSKVKKAQPSKAKKKSAKTAKGR